MKNFLKTFLAALLANIVGLGCAVFFVFAGIIAMIGSLATLGASWGAGSSEPLVLQANTILKVDLGSLSDVVQEDPFASFSKNTKTSTPIALSEAVRAIAMAKNNPNISALYLNIESIDGGLASVDELRRALLDFKKSKKPIIAYADFYSQKAYYLASLADHLLLNPQGGVELTGIAAGRTMYKDAMDKLGVKMEVFKVGTFKSAVEPYILNKMSEENKLQMQEYIDGLWASIVAGVAEGRKLSPEAVKTFANEGRSFSPADSLVKMGYVDSLVYRADIKHFIAHKISKEPKSLKMITLADMAKQSDPSITHSDNTVKVIFAEGDITDAVQDYWNTTASTIGYSLVDELNEARDDDNIHAVVLRVNSPGGSAFLSEQIWYAVKSLRSKKPVVVSMGDYAASGGYYISAPANMIVAEANTLTGSIGIFGMIPNASELAGKLGLNVDVVKTSEYADLGVGMPLRPMTDGQRALIQRNVEQGYDTFLSRVAEGRKMSKAAVDSVGQGRVWLGKKAISLGLVDKLGGLSVAIQEVAKIAKLKDYYVDYGATSKNVLMELLESQSPSDEFIARFRAKMLTREEREMLRLVKGQTYYAGIQARLPYEFASY